MPKKTVWRDFLYGLRAVPPYELSFLRAGDSNGRRVIFIHGTPGNAEAWTDYLLAVPAGYEFISVDRPGFGESGPEHAVRSLEEQARALSYLLEERDGFKTVLVGHSLGGPIVAQVAADFPDRVAGIMIAAGSLDPSLEEIHPMQHVGDIWPIRAILPRAIRNSNHELFELKDELLKLQAKLKEVVVPIKIIHGTKDDLVPFSNVAFMKENFTNATLDVTVLTDRNHFIPWHSKAEMDEALQRLIQTIDSR